jgi:hypothetical protein
MPVPTGIEDNRFRQLRMAAEKLGANMVLLPDEPTAGMSGEDVLRGEAYKCALPE